MIFEPRFLIGGAPPPDAAEEMFMPPVRRGGSTGDVERGVEGNPAERGVSRDGMSAMSAMLFLLRGDRATEERAVHPPPPEPVGIAEGARIFRIEYNVERPAHLTVLG